MSSPMSSLKKGKKVPLGPRSNVPYRNPLAFSTGQSEEEMFNQADIPNAFLKRDMKTRMPSISQQSGSSAPSDSQLISSMAARLAQTEQQLKASTREIIEKDKKIKILQEKVHLLERARSYGSENIQELEKKCQQLSNQVHEMEMFLADYGMVWVGDDDVPDTERNISSYVELGDEAPADMSSTSSTLITQAGMWQQGQSLGVPNFKMDFELVLKNIQELNILANEGTAHITHNKGGARLKVQDSVPLCLYSNGILMFSGPFRPYTDPTTQTCMQDIMDGFFPSELQGRYPEGVPFKVTDRRETVYRDRTTELLFPGEGQAVNSEDNSDRKQETKADRIGSGKRLSMEQFLSKIPNSVVKNGKIIDVRSGVAETIQGPSGKNTVTVVETKVIEDMKARVDQGTEQENTQDVTTLRVKSETGENVFILKMKFTDTISDVRYYLDMQRPSDAPAYDIKTSFPNKVYTQPELTLQECGLVPNATLHLLARKNQDT